MEYMINIIKIRFYQNKVLSKILNKTIFEVYISMINNYKKYFKNIEVINPNLKLITFPSYLTKSFKKFELKNIEEIYINDNDLYDILYDDYVNNSNNLSEKQKICNNLFHKINKDVKRMSFSNSFIINFNKNIKIMEICLDSTIDKNIENILKSLIKMKKENKVEKLILFLIKYDKEYLNILFNCFYIDKICIYDYCDDFDVSMYPNNKNRLILYNNLYN